MRAGAGRAAMTRGGGASRSRWAAIGAAVAVAGGGLLTASAADSAPGTYVAITPCRVVDTRAGSDNVGPRATPIGDGETYSTAFVGAVGKCNIPANAVAVVLNLAIVNPTGNSFLTVFPTGGSVPLAANLNFVAFQAPVSNAATVQIGSGGQISFFNLRGTVDVTADVAGYYVPAGGGSNVTPGRSKTETIVYSPAALNWVFGDENRLPVNNCITRSTGSTTAQIPLDLPIGSRISSISAAILDSSSSATSYSLSLKRSTVTDTGISNSANLLEIAGGSNSGVQFGAAAGSAVFTVTDTESYYLEFVTGAATNAFCNATVTYTTP